MNNLIVKLTGSSDRSFMLLAPAIKEEDGHIEYKEEAEALFALLAAGLPGETFNQLAGLFQQQLRDPNFIYEQKKNIFQALDKYTKLVQEEE